MSCLTHPALFDSGFLDNVARRRDPARGVYRHGLVFVQGVMVLGIDGLRVANDLVL
jgi:hypothetical protein